MKRCAFVIVSALAGIWTMAGCGEDFSPATDGPDAAAGSAGSGATAGSGGASGAGGSAGSGGETCTPGQSEPCYGGPSGTADVGICKGGTHTCNDDGTGFGACDGEVVPAAEDCTNDLDDDCDGIVCSELQWAKLAGDAEDQGVIFLATDDSDDVFVGGSFDGTIDFGGHALVSLGNSDPDAYVAKLDPTGKVLWAKNFGTLNFWDADVDSANNLIVVGWYEGIGQFGSIGLPIPDQNFVAKISPIGDVLWAKSVARKEGFQPYVAVAPNDRVLVAHGTSAGTNGTSVQATITAFTAAGAPDGSQKLPTGVNHWTYPSQIAVDANGNPVVALGFQNQPTFGGQTLTSAGSDDVAFVKLDATLGTLWALHFGGTDYDRAIGVQIDPVTGTIYMLGEFSGTAQFAGEEMTSNSPSDMFLVAAGTGGNVLWRKQFGGLSSPWANGFTLDGAGNIAVGGLATSALDFGGGPVTGVFIAKLTAAGDHVWSKGFGTEGIGWALVADSQDNLILGGVADAPLDFGAGLLTPKGVDAFVAKFAP